jgi:hypothetical protein
MVYPARSVSADPLVFAVGAVHVTSILLSVAVGGDVDVDEVPDGAVADVVLLDIESPGTVLVALAAAFEALVVLEPLHPASRPEASSKEQTIHESLAPITRSS